MTGLVRIPVLHDVPDRKKNTTAEAWQERKACNGGEFDRVGGKD